MAKYAWKITKVTEAIKSIQNDVGVMGPRSVDAAVLLDRPARFRLYDDDWRYTKAEGGTPWICEGVIGGDFEGFEPLDDFGMPSYGCTTVAILHTEKPTDRAIELVMEKDDAGWWVML